MVGWTWRVGYAGGLEGWLHDLGAIGPLVSGGLSPVQW